LVVQVNLSNFFSCPPPRLRGAGFFRGRYRRAHPFSGISFLSCTCMSSGFFFSMLAPRGADIVLCTFTLQPISRAAHSRDLSQARQLAVSTGCLRFGPPPGFPFFFPPLPFANVALQGTATAFSPAVHLRAEPPSVRRAVARLHVLPAPRLR